MASSTQQLELNSPKWRKWILIPFGAAIVSLSTVVALYVAVGSYIFPVWWYGYFWDGGFHKPEYIPNALRILVDQYFRLSMVTVLLLLAAIFICVALRTRLLLVTRRFGLLIMLADCSVVIVTALLIRHTAASSYLQVLAFEEGMGKVRDSFQTVRSLSAHPVIRAPIYFHYVDNERVEGLYNQLIPELQENEREVKGASGVKGKAGVEVGENGASIEASRDSESRTVYNRSDFSAQRKCIEVMEYAQKTWPNNYYSTEFDWFYARVVSDLGKNVAQFKGPFDPPDNNPEVLATDVDQLWKRNEEKMKKEQQDLQSELALLQGWVFVDGEFEKSLDRGKMVLVEKFSNNPAKYAFKIFFPATAAQSLPSIKPLKLRVFGEVTRPLNDVDHYIDVSGVAIF